MAALKDTDSGLFLGKLLQKLVGCERGLFLVSISNRLKTLTEREDTLASMCY